MIKFNKNFKSSIDQFLENFDKQHPKKSLSQQEEIENASRIKQLMTNSGKRSKGDYSPRRPSLRTKAATASEPQQMAVDAKQSSKKDSQIPNLW